MPNTGIQTDGSCACPRRRVGGEEEDGAEDRAQDGLQSLAERLHDPSAMREPLTIDSLLTERAPKI